ncbi:MAG: methyltransferase [Proteobacteria bacterium]|nr:methyltransferase [Pseudomonadota bacterium]
MAFEERILAGVCKGKRLVLPRNQEVRPSKQRVRQGVFNMLESRLDWRGLRVVDLCTGSGSWGLEAASRGAKYVLLLDKDLQPARQNAAECCKMLQNAAAGEVALVQVDVRRWVPGEKFDVVLADPPYGKGMVQALLRRASEVSVPGSWWAVEYGAGEELDWSGFEGVAVRRHGVSEVAVGRFVTRNP